MSEDVIEIPLTKGYVAIIDRADVHLAAFKWKAHPVRNGTVYACRNVYGAGGNVKTVQLHRAIMGDACEGLYVDHIDGNGLNNRRENLRAVNKTTNGRNISGAFRHNTSGILGVSWHSRDQRWRANIKVGGHQIHLGNFDTIEAAEAARLSAEAKLWGIQPRRAEAHVGKESEHG